MDRDHLVAYLDEQLDAESFQDVAANGLQVAGRPFDEAMVLRVAHAYEQVAGWTQRRPPGFD